MNFRFSIFDFRLKKRRKKSGVVPPRPNPKSKIQNPKSSGIALIVTLAMLVLVTIAALAFFSRATANRTIEASRSNQVLAEQLARTASDYVAGSFLGEIIAPANSSNSTSGNVTIYQSSNSTFAVPQRPLPAFASGTDFSNLVRRSVNESVNGVGETNASAHGTATASKNGRVIGTARWNAPFLLRGSGFSADAQLPNWIYINKDGTATATPSASAIGRFAYNVYNIGGLLDANVAGHPANVTGNNLADIKGTLAGADLTRIPGVAAADTFTAWRNGSSVTIPAAYVANVTQFAQSGFLRAPTGNQVFAGRQDLIRLAQNGSIGITADALPYLTTFSRTVDGPSFTPDPARSKVQSQTPALPTLGLDDAFNPSLIGTRVQTAFTRADGSQAKAGEPLIKKKFPLSRLSLLESAAGAVTSSNPIYKYFGLTRSSANDPWTYNHGAADRILQLSEVVTAGREPDFFELLQACIPVGSLGKSLGQTTAYAYLPPAPGQSVGDVARDIYSKYQILQIGANLIDQWDADSYPTAIQLKDGNWLLSPDIFTFSGIENLPYLTRIFGNLFREMGPDPANPSGPQVEFMHFFLHPEVWNPHQSASIPPSAPAQFRFVMVGNYTLTVNGTFQPGGTFSANGTRGITFSGANLSEPKLLDTIGTAIDPRDTKTPSSGPFSGTPIVGMLMGSSTPPSGPLYSNLVNPDPLSYHLQYNRGGQWITYSSMREHRMRMLLPDISWAPTGWYPSGIRYWISRGDPRVERFGYILSYNYGGMGSGTQANETQRPNSADIGAQVWDNSKWDTYPGWSPLGPYPYVSTVGQWQWAYCWGLLTGNKPGSATSYKDADGVNRLGDAAFSNGDLGEPMTTGNLASRPVILNRPFRSFGEMGYAGRDVPWKTLDLFTADSADGALLDAFCINENDAGDVVAGKVDLNTRQSVVLEALLVGAAKLPGSEITTAQAPGLAAQIRAAVTANPLSNLADLGKSITSNATVASALGSTADAAIKAQREVLTRALGDVGQVRTWNLLADIVVQSGRFPVATATGAGDFVVEAEQRIWASLAIDRPTATVINSQTELIQE